MIHAIKMHQVGGPEVLSWEEYDPGLPGPGEVRIIHEAIGLNFATTLRSFLRQDPNQVLVGEIRDFIEADSLAYLSLEGLLGCLGGEDDSYCTACWSGEYRVPISTADPRQGRLFPIQVEERV